MLTNNYRNSFNKVKYRFAEKESENDTKTPDGSG